ncbi:hypothetical protein DAEQUDRAFT_723253 [Daedalea quercina L-15889]|uniref:F-box domain-containing protein n=1 Tax=Daedalea quercina L-15889 TaxID=1314783 RepID=A0A165SJH9_9APHY|nr:hypothetical protein DAEQUDRAFT_723253 [Daedalea quercina L-15889]
MAASQPALPALPEDILFNIFSRLDERSQLVSMMLVRRAWYGIAERLQYADIILRFPLFEEVADSRAIRCLTTLTTRQTAANAARHLAVSGALNGETIPLLLDALSQTTRLLSLELRVSDRTTESTFHTLWQASCESSRFLPQLSAINTEEAGVAIAVTQGRPMSVFGLPALIGPNVLPAVIASLQDSATSMAQLRLFVEVENMSTAEEMVRTLCRTLPSLSVLALQLRFPSPCDVTWDTFGGFLDGIEPSLRRLHSLRVLGLVLIPDPIDLASRYEERTRELARSLIDRFPQLHRVELRWHGWIISADEWAPVRQRRLLRQLDYWFYTDTRHRLELARYVDDPSRRFQANLRPVVTQYLNTNRFFTFTPSRTMGLNRSRLRLAGREPWSGKRGRTRHAFSVFFPLLPWDECHLRWRS